jgi:hypothetical protein
MKIRSFLGMDIEEEDGEKECSGIKNAIRSANRKLVVSLEIKLIIHVYLNKLLKFPWN